MKLSSTDIDALCKLAIEAAKSAGALISSYQNKSIEVLKKNTGDSYASQVVTEVDFKSQELILNILKPSIHQFDLAILSEEIQDTKNRLKKNYFWCIDPLDGTLPFTEGLPGYAVSIALIALNGEPQIGVVYDPVEHNLYHAIKNKGAYRNNIKWHLPTPSRSENFQFYYNRSFKSLDNFEIVKQELNKIAEKKFATTLNLNQPAGAVMNACLALENTPSCYFAFPKKIESGGSLWDYAATACIYQEIGASVSDIYGNPLDLNNPDSTFMNSKGILFASNTYIRDYIQEIYAILK